MNKLFILISTFTLVTTFNSYATDLETAGRKADQAVEEGKVKAKEMGQSAAQHVESGAQTVEEKAREVEYKLN